jgi:Meiotically up-regulated gene 113
MNVNDARRADIIRLVKEIAAKDGAAPGQKKFAAETGIKEHVWRGKMWRAWGEALADAGFTANEWTSAIPTEEIFDAVADLATRLGRFPTLTYMQMEHTANPSFPAHKAVARTGSMLEVATAIRMRVERDGSATLVELADKYLASLRARPKSDPVGDEADDIGHVYLIRYGKDFKIGRTSSVVRRSRQVQVELPDATELVHSILTDDPAGVEAYWHRRFADHRGNGEWFRLPQKAVASFKKWTKII